MKTDLAAERSGQIEGLLGTDAVVLEERAEGRDAGGNPVSRHAVIIQIAASEVGGGIHAALPISIRSNFMAFGKVPPPVITFSGPPGRRSS